RVSDPEWGVPDTVTARKAGPRKPDPAGVPRAALPPPRRTLAWPLMASSVGSRGSSAGNGRQPATSWAVSRGHQIVGGGLASWASYVDHKSVDVDVAASALA